MIKNKDKVTSFEKNAKKLITKYMIPGVAIGLAQDAIPVYEKGFGFRNVDNQLPVTMDTVFGIASVTKSFTCMAIMQLQEAGKLSVQDPVFKYLPELLNLRNTTDKMTVHHFMTHSAGLPPLPTILYANKKSVDITQSEYKDFKHNDSNQKSIHDYEQLMEFISQLEFDLLGEPGSEFSYSNDCYALLGAIIERVSGVPFERYIKENILLPAGMINSCFLFEELPGNKNITSLYASRMKDHKAEIFEDSTWPDAPSMRAAGYLKSTVRDMLKYTRIFTNNGKVGENQILNSNSVQQMIYPHIEFEPGKYYGYGFMIDPNYFGGTLIEHGGNFKGIASQLCIIPERRIAGVILTNLARVPSPKILKGALNIVENRNFDATSDNYEEFECTLKDLYEYEGTYISIAENRFIISVEGGSLQFSIHEEGIPIQCIGKDTFLASIRDQSEVIRFIRNNKGEIVRLAYHYRQYHKLV
ncbi:beta-lactamase family protein [Rossellomorea marisflavi]|uniref:serine hydrolase domain-containing protein n=2 Tax=Rossellomorea marisflavi TaxID=189381 RepID=UPI0027A94A4E|nr:serine hydrolase domain-containing protein [Rossellomorea marisflavi]UTE72066.1 beta-lactamase family protein [Rossellomorea marisflavi]